MTRDLSKAELHAALDDSRTRLLDPTFRNFYEPQRDDIFLGFRSARSM